MTSKPNDVSVVSSTSGGVQIRGSTLPTAGPEFVEGTGVRLIWGTLHDGRPGPGREE